MVPSLHIEAGTDSAAGRREERGTDGERNKRWEEETMGNIRGAIRRWQRAHMDVLVSFPCCLRGAGAKTAGARKQEKKKNSQRKVKSDSKLAKEILEALKDVMEKCWGGARAVSNHERKVRKLLKSILSEVLSEEPFHRAM